jgi:6,7-dimethyl-8-ribityllumazine synthase
MASSDEVALQPGELERLTAAAGATLEGAHTGAGLRIGVVCSRFNGTITTRLLEGCLDELADLGVDRQDVVVAWVPGAFEVPCAARAFATADVPYDAVVTLGAVIRGETGHYEVVAGECARGVQEIAVITGIPVVFGVLTCDTVGQALERSAPDASNKGREAALAAVEMARLLERPQLS